MHDGPDVLSFDKALPKRILHSEALGLVQQGRSSILALAQRGANGMTLN